MTRAKARVYFAVQALAGALWWLAVFTSDDVRWWTLGDWDPGLLVGPDLALFVGASALAAALGSRVWAVVASAWTTLVAVALTGYALVAREAGWGAVLMIIATVGTLAATLTLQSGRMPVQWFFIGPFAFRVAGNQSRGRHLRRSLVQLVFFWTSFLILLPLVLSWVERRLRLDWDPLQRSGFARAGPIVFLVASAFGLWSCVSMALLGEGTPLPAATARNLGGRRSVPLRAQPDGGGGCPANGGRRAVARLLDGDRVVDHGCPHLEHVHPTGRRG